VSDIIELTITEAAARIERRDLSPVELTRAYLARIEHVDGQLNSFLTLDADQALRAAEIAETEIAGGTYRGPLHGMPLALKDLYDTAGLRTTAGSRFDADRLPERDAEAVRRLRNLGMVLLGKLNMHEWALGVTNANPHYGDCHNPYDTSRSPGGSSGGSGAAVAARLCIASLGSDTGGSIRIPASLCGIVGLKPTFGRISLRGVVPLSWNLDHAGPLTRSVPDAAILLQAIAGYDAADPASAFVPTDGYDEGIDAGVEGWKIAIATDAHFRDADAEVLSAVDAAAGRLSELGADIGMVELNDAAAAAQANALMTTSDAAACHHEQLRDQPDMFGADVLERMRRGAAYTSTEYILARRRQAVWRRYLDEFFETYDVLLTAATPITAPVLDDTAVEKARVLTRFTAPFNLAGLPALVLPCGVDAAGLPIGLQIVGSAWAEARVLRAGRAFEQAAGLRLAPPL
jgi:aspartyl-tRNA(Asn)/glutamyl-tRNA(Gln) amidotransferase subunit A